MEDYQIIEVLVRGWRAQKAIQHHATKQMSHPCYGCAIFASKMLMGWDFENVKDYLCENMREWRKAVEAAEEVLKQYERTF